MKRLIKTFAFIVTVALSVSLLTACGGGTPTRACFAPSHLSIRATQLSPGILTWSEISESSGYTIKLTPVDGGSAIIADVSATEADISQIENLTVGTTYDVEVLAKGGKTIDGTKYTDSAWSSTTDTYTHKNVSGEAFDMPEIEVNNANGILSWDSVTDAPGYVLRLEELWNSSYEIVKELDVGSATTYDLKNQPSNATLIYSTLSAGEYRISVAVKATINGDEFVKGSAYSPLEKNFIIEEVDALDENTVELTSTSIKFMAKENMSYDITLKYYYAESSARGASIGVVDAGTEREVTIDLNGLPDLPLNNIDYPLVPGRYEIVFIFGNLYSSDTQNDNYAFTYYTTSTIEIEKFIA